MLGVKSRDCSREGWRSNGILAWALFLPATEDGLLGEDGATGLEDRGEDVDTPIFGGGMTLRDGLEEATGTARGCFVGELRGEEDGSSGMTKGCEYFDLWNVTTCCQCASSSFVEHCSVG